ncbi:hypothetical protein [Duganella vulcania]|uniref:Uncharacterized protein n=1 Tax=Duganella vulcania TaxID=2692166 RepID=A0A845GGQ2_9BURK|nr:hypothetical protein [Duganella vulcania]MYM92690.1 hypothetical protein [Duganella vulcania]
MVNIAQPASQPDVRGDLPLDSWLRGVHPGQQVWWNDPSIGLWSGHYIVDEIQGNAVTRQNTPLILREVPESSVRASIEARAAELSPTKPEDLLPVVDRYEGASTIRGYATTKQQALYLGNAVLDHMVIVVDLAENVTMHDGTVLEKAWVASTGMAEFDQD